jgi:molecular chaperone DnaK
MSRPAAVSVGIDLGTTYSSLAYVDAQGVPRVVADSTGQTVLPSVVFFDDEEIIVGDIAWQQAKLRPDRVVQFIKVHMGDPWRREFRGRAYTPESISAIILGQLIKEAAPEIGPIRRAVITVPAYFTEKRRRATQQAGEIAGLEVLGTLDEPMAAALAYGLQRTDHEQRVVVYDLGGGTFDVTVLRISPDELEEVAIRGNRQLGGRDWDQVLIDFVADGFQKVHRQDLRAAPQAMQELLLECEQAKRRLSRMAKTLIRAHAFGCEHTVELTREQFEAMTAPLLQATKLTTETALADAKLTWQSVSRVVLVGGSTLMPAVRRMLSRASGREPETSLNPVLAVALGAAVYVHLLETGQPFRALQAAAQDTARPSDAMPGSGGLGAGRSAPTAGPSLRFVTAHGVGLKIRRGNQWSNEVLIARNTPVPVSVTRRFRTRSAGGRKGIITIDITQGDTPDAAAAELLGTGTITGLPADEPDGQPVDVTMAFDEQGRLHIRACYVPRNQHFEISLEIPHGLRNEEVLDQRRFLEETGFFSPRRVAEMIEAIDDDDDDDDLPLLTPIA